MSRWLGNIRYFDVGSIGLTMSLGDDTSGSGSVGIDIADSNFARVGR